MFSKRIVLASAFLLLAHAGLAAAQETADPASSPLVSVTGLAMNDLLNLRATASATGMLVARLQNGTLLKQLDCSDVEGNQWCKVQAADDPKLMGWAPARYLTEAQTGEDLYAPSEDVLGEPSGDVLGEPAAGDGESAE